MENDYSEASHIASHLLSVMSGENVAESGEETCKQEVGDVGATEQAEAFGRWVRENHSAICELNRLSDEKQWEQDFADYTVPTREKEERAGQLLEKISCYERRRKTRRLLRWVSGVAAAVVIAIGGLLLIPEKQDAWENSLLAGNVPEGVYLVREDRSVVALDHTTDSICLQDLTFYKEGENQVASFGPGSDSLRMTYNTLVVPPKTIYTLRLPDATLVTLNAQSRITFPNRFIGTTREVKIQGECYFKVATDSLHPFVVRYEDVKIQVYGTQFNVNTYSLDVVETVLVEGCVSVAFRGERETILSPSQMASADLKRRTAAVSRVDVSHYTAWLSNYFDFEAASLEKVIGEISCWYGVQLRAESNPEVSITASYSRHTDLKEILISLERLSGIKIENINF